MRKGDRSSQKSRDHRQGQAYPPEVNPSKSIAIHVMPPLLLDASRASSDGESRGHFAPHG